MNVAGKTTFNTSKYHMHFFSCLVGSESAENDAGEPSDSSQGLLHRRDRLIRQKRLVEVDLAA